MLQVTYTVNLNQHEIIQNLPSRMVIADQRLDDLPVTTKIVVTNIMKLFMENN